MDIILVPVILIIILLAGVVAFCISSFLEDHTINLKLIRHVKISNSDYILTIEGNELPFRVRGSCTVWHSYPSGARCSSRYESKICDIWHGIKWNEKGENYD